MQEIQDLEIGASIKINGDIPKIRQVCTRLPNKYKVVQVTAESCLVVRVELDVKGLKEKVLEGIATMPLFGELVIHGNISYVRTIVSTFNTENNRAVKVSKRRTVAILTEDIMTRPSITTDEFNAIELDFEEKLTILEAKIVDVMDEELL